MRTHIVVMYGRLYFVCYNSDEKILWKMAFNVDPEACEDDDVDFTIFHESVGDIRLSQGIGEALIPQHLREEMLKELERDV